MAALKPATTKDTESTSSKVWGFLKYAIPAAAAVGAVAAIVLFPPALALITPAVEWLAANAIPAFASAYAGLISFSAISAGIAAAAAATTAALMAAGKAVVNAFTAKDPVAKATVAKPAVTEQKAAAPEQKQAEAPAIHKNPTRAADPVVQPVVQPAQTFAHRPGMSA